MINVFLSSDWFDGSFYSCLFCRLCLWFCDFVIIEKWNRLTTLSIKFAPTMELRFEFWTDMFLKNCCTFGLLCVNSESVNKYRNHFPFNNRDANNYNMYVCVWVCFSFFSLCLFLCCLCFCFSHALSSFSPSYLQIISNLL